MPGAECGMTKTTAYLISDYSVPFANAKRVISNSSKPKSKTTILSPKALRAFKRRTINYETTSSVSKVA